MKKIKFALLTFIPLLSLILSGCDSCDNCGASDVLLKGVAMKGAMRNAKVSAYPIQNGVVSDTALATTDTNSLGQYNLAIEVDGPFLVRIESTQSTETICDVRPSCGDVNFGKPTKAQFILEAVVARNSKEEINVNITPLTTLAASYAKDNGGTNDVIVDINRRVSEAFGLSDIISLRPTDITETNKLSDPAQPVDAIKYGYYSAAVAKIAYARFNGDIQKAIDAIVANAKENKGLLKKSNDANDQTTISLADVATAAQALIEAETSVSGGVFAIAKADITDLMDDAVAAGPVTPERIQIGKDTVKELRTWSYSIRQNLSASTQRFAQKIRTAFEQDGAASEAVSRTTALASAALIEAYLRHQLGLIANNTFDLRNSIVLEKTPATGSIHVEGDRAWLVGAKINDNTIEEEIRIPEITNGTTFSLELLSLRVENNGATLTADSTLRNSITFEFVKAISEIHPSELDKMIRRIEFGYGGTFDQKPTTTNTDPVRFAGRFSANIVSVTSSATNNSTWNPKSVSYKGEFATQSGDKITAEFGFTMANADVFAARDTDNFFKVNVSYNIGTYWFEDNKNALVLNTPNVNIVYRYDPTTKVVYEIQTLAQVYVYVVKHNSRAYASLQDFIATDAILNGSCVRCLEIWIDHQGMYQVEVPRPWEQPTDSNNPNGPTMPGTLIGRLKTQVWDDETSASWRDIDAYFETTLDLADMPPANVRIDFDRTGYRSFTGSIRVSYDDVRIFATLNNRSADTWLASHDYHIFINTKAGGRLEVYYDRKLKSVQGNVKVRKQVVGELTTDSFTNQIRMDYKDGQFESILF